MKLVGRIGQKLRIKRTGNLSSKKIGLGFADSHRAPDNFRFAVELFKMHRWYVDRSGAQTPASRETRNHAIGHRSRSGCGIEPGKSRQETWPGPRAEPPV